MHARGGRAWRGWVGVGRGFLGTDGGGTLIEIAQRCEDGGGFGIFTNEPSEHLERGGLARDCRKRVCEACLSDETEILAAYATLSSQSIVNIEAIPSRSSQ